MLEWAAICFFRASSWFRDHIRVSCTAGSFFTTEPPGKPQTPLSLSYFQLFHQSCSHTFVVVNYSLSHVQLFLAPWTIAHQAPLSMGFPKQEYWSGLPFPFPGYLSWPRIEPMSPALQLDSLPLRHPGSAFSYIPRLEVMVPNQRHLSKFPGENLYGHKTDYSYILVPTGCCLRLCQLEKSRKWNSPVQVLPLTFCTWTHKDRMKALLLSFTNFQPLEESFQLTGSQPLVRNSSLVRTLSLRAMRETYRSIWI